MKTSILLVATAALLATATPLKKRVMVTDWVTEVEWVTLYEDGTSQQTPAVNVEAPKATTPPAALANDNSVKPHTTSAAPSSSTPTPTPQPTKPQPVVVDVQIPEVETPKVQPPVLDVKTQTKTPVLEAKPQTPKTSSPPKSTPKSSPPQQAPATNNLNSYQKTVLDHHAILRKNHGVQPLEWDETLAQYAANTAKGCVFQHDMNQGNGHYGQNLASNGISGDISGQEVESIRKAISDMWYKSEINSFSSFYGMSQPPSSSFHAYGHATQLLWKDTRKVGCATVKCPAGTIFGMNSQYSVCNYGPPGNVQGQYGENVLPPLGLDISIV
ncbi:hypothetical protein E4U09_007137 [Claviceps aff. purpurea]|uniref:SCP domain-containing protein n=1 Tax=Claviceps aff. purpurea TaxID=1967640 RepID=A0A9P7U2R5_9HYPO|nr:hypothetical protein E4U09_007137 [Claviceps aff. purpurea]